MSRRQEPPPQQQEKEKEKEKEEEKKKKEEEKEKEKEQQQQQSCTPRERGDDAETIGRKSERRSKRSSAVSSDGNGGSSEAMQTARPAGYAESPGRTRGSYVNENVRLVVSEPQYTSREKRTMGFAPEIDVASSFSQSLTKPEGSPRLTGRSRPPLTQNNHNHNHNNNQNNNNNNSGVGGGNFFVAGGDDSVHGNGPGSPNSTPQEQVIGLNRQGSNRRVNSPRWWPLGGGGATRNTTALTPSPFPEREGSPAPAGAAGSGPSPPDTDPHATPSQRQPKPSKSKRSPRQVASSEVSGIGVGVDIGGEDDDVAASSPRSGTLRPHHPASGPPATSFVRHNLQSRRESNSAGVSGDMFLTPPPVSTLRAANGLGRGREYNSNSDIMHASPLSTSAASPVRLPTAPVGSSSSSGGGGGGGGGGYSNGNSGARYAGLLSSLSPRRHQQPFSAQDALLGGGVRSREAFGLTHNGASLESMAANNNSNNNGESHYAEAVFGNTRLLTSIRELTKRRISEDINNAAVYQRGEIGGGGTRAFALGGGGGGGANLYDIGSTGVVGGNGSVTAIGCNVGSAGGTGILSSPRKAAVHGRKQRKMSLLANANASTTSSSNNTTSKPRGKKNQFSLHGTGGHRHSRSRHHANTPGISGDINELFNTTNSNRTLQQQRTQQQLRLDAEAAAAAAGDDDNENNFEDIDDNNGDDDDFFSDPPTRGNGILSTSPPTPPPPVLSLSPMQSSNAPQRASVPLPSAASASPPCATPAYDFKVILSSGTGSSKPIVLASGSGCVQGMRNSMEDEHFVALNEKVVRDQPVSLVGILDGHCGRRVATLGKKLLPQFFFKHSALGDNNALAMVESVLQTDRSVFYELHNKKKLSSSSSSKKPAPRGRQSNQPQHQVTSSGDDIFNTTRNGEEADDDDVFASLAATSGGMVGGGSTLIAAAVHGRMLYVACLGDARAVLLDGRTTIAMSEDHKPQNPKESKRIARCGGFVQFGRVCGVLAVSRALGDFEFKFSSEGGDGVPWWTANETSLSVSTPSAPTPPGSRGGGGRPGKANNSRFYGNRELMVSNVADVKQLSLTDDSMFLVLACDGLWDVLSNVEATQFVRDFLTYTPDINDPLAASGQKPKPSAAVVKRALDSCCQKLAEFAVDRGSTDNVSVTVLFFHDVVECVVGFSSAHNNSKSKQGSGLQSFARSSAGSSSASSRVLNRGGQQTTRSGDGLVGSGTTTLRRKKEKKKASKGLN